MARACREVFLFSFTNVVIMAERFGEKGSVQRAWQERPVNIFALLYSIMYINIVWLVLVCLWRAGGRHVFGRCTRQHGVSFIFLSICSFVVASLCVIFIIMVALI